MSDPILNEEVPAWSEDQSDPSTRMTLIVGFIGVVVTLAMVIWLIAMFNIQVAKEVERKAAMRPPVEIQRYRAEQESRLHGYEWVDPEAGVVAIPIERAMEIVVREARDGSG